MEIKNSEKNKNSKTSLLVTCYDPVIIDFNPSYMCNNIINKLQDKENCYKILSKFNDKIIIAFFHNFIKTYNEDFSLDYDTKISGSYFDFKQIRENIFSIITYMPSTFYIYDMLNKKILFQKYIGQNFSSVCKINENKVLFGSITGELHIFNINTYKLLKINKNHIQGEINSMIKLKNTSGFISTGNFTIKFWDEESFVEKNYFFENNKFGVINPKNNSWSKIKEFDDGRIAFFSDDNNINLLDVRSGIKSVYEGGKYTSIVYDFFEIDQNCFLSCSEKIIAKWDKRVLDYPVVEFKTYFKLSGFEKFI